VVTASSAPPVVSLNASLRIGAEQRIYEKTWGEVQRRRDKRSAENSSSPMLGEYGQEQGPVSLGRPDVREAVTRTQVHASYLSVLNAVAAR
jgi:hypothetical protein